MFCSVLQYIYSTLFWNEWKMKKSSFENLTQWWEAQFFATVQRLERDIVKLEKGLMDNPGTVQKEFLKKKRMEHGSFLQEQTKGAFIKDMDAPSSYLFIFLI